MAKKVQRFDWTYNVEEMSVTVVDKVTQESRTWRPEEYPVEVQSFQLLYGHGKLMQDRASDVVADNKFDYFDALAAAFAEGKTALERAERGPQVSMPILLTLMEVIGVDLEQAQAIWADNPKDARERFLKAHAATIAAHKAKSRPKVDISLDDCLET